MMMNRLKKSFHLAKILELSQMISHIFTDKCMLTYHDFINYCMLDQLNQQDFFLCKMGLSKEIMLAI